MVPKQESFHGNRGFRCQAEIKHLRFETRHFSLGEWPDGNCLGLMLR